MPVMRTYKVSDIEKRLKLLNQQLYGKQEKVVSSPRSEAGSKYQEPLPTTDLAYLKQDLRKIAILAFLAIGVQFIPFFSQLLNKIKLF